MPDDPKEHKFELKIGSSCQDVDVAEMRLYQQQQAESIVAQWKHDNNPGSCGHNPCLWKHFGDDVISWDETEHGDLTGENTVLNNVRRKRMFRQMALLINGGPMGKGERMQHAECVLSGVRGLFPAEDGVYMGHMDN